MADKKSEKTESELWKRFKANPALFIGTFFVLIIVIIAFVLVPAIVPEYGGRGDFDMTFGYYDGAPIAFASGNFFNEYYNRVVRWRQSMGDQNFDARSPEVWREAYEVAALHVAILQEMKKAGYTAPEKIVDREVARNPQFLDENGRFSSTLYRLKDENERMSIWRQTQEDIAKEHFRTDVTGVLIPEAEAEFIGKMATAQRSFDMAVFSVEGYPESEYETYMQEHPDLFRSIHLSAVTVTSSEREAQKILDLIKNGETTFEEAARSYSKDNYAERGGDLGVRMVHELLFDIPEEADREKIIALGKGEYSDVIKIVKPDNTTTWSFFRIEEAAQDADPSDESTMERVRYYVRNFEAFRMEEWAIAQANDFRALADEIGLEDALAQQGLEKRSFGPVPINYGNVDLFTTLSSQIDREFAGAASNENFWKVAFKTPVNASSEPVVQGRNVLVLFPNAETEAEESEGREYIRELTGLFTNGKTEAEESSIEDVVSRYSRYSKYMSEQAMQQYFMNNPKMVDKFNETYSKYRRYFAAEQ